MVVIVVGCHLLEGAFQDMLDLLDALLLGGEAEVVSIDERAALWGEGLVVGVDVKEEGGHYASLWLAVLLGFPFALLIVWLNEEACVVEEAFDDFAQVKVTSHVKEFPDHGAVLDSVIGSSEVYETGLQTATKI